jgi:pimeloyl-ACP methyl ester carboxylesterase
MRRSRVPALFVAGGADQIAPPRTVEAAHALWGGEKRYRSFPGYGHVDLVFGRTAPDEVFPEIAAFLDAHARARPAPDPDRALSAAVV